MQLEWSVLAQQDREAIFDIQIYSHLRTKQRDHQTLAISLKVTLDLTS